MPTEAYQQILKRAETELAKDEQQQLADVLAQVAARRDRRPRKITDLEGLGEKIWKDVDADEYVAKERDSWDG